MRDRSSSVKGDDPSNVLFDTWLTARAAIALLDSALAGTGLDAEDFAVYSVLRQAGEISPGELARWMSAPATTVSSQRYESDSRARTLTAMPSRPATVKINANPRSGPCRTSP